MESWLWQRAKDLGRAEACGETIVRVLVHHLGAVDPALRERIRALVDQDLLNDWYDEALFLRDAEAAQRLADKIRKALLL